MGNHKFQRSDKISVTGFVEKQKHSMNFKRTWNKRLFFLTLGVAIAVSSA